MALHSVPCSVPPLARLQRLRSHLGGGVAPPPPPPAAHAAAQLLRPAAAAAAATSEDLGLFPTADPAVALAQLEREGFCVLSGVLPPLEIARLRTQAEQQIADVPAVLADAEAGGPNRQATPEADAWH